MKRLATAVALVVFLLSSRAEARPGVRIGLTDDPESLFLGFFYEIPLAPAGPGIFVLDPGADIGFADEDGDGDDDIDLTLRGQLNIKYFIPIDRFFLYPLMGLSLYWWDHNDRGDDNDLSAGLNLGLGFAFAERFNLELYATVEGAPDITFSFGFVF